MTGGEVVPAFGYATSPPAGSRHGVARRTSRAYGATVTRSISGA